MMLSTRVAAVVVILVLLPILVPARHILRSHHNHHNQRRPRTEIVGSPESDSERKEPKPRRPETVEVAGSRLPDCSHACGSCKPCRLVMVSFVCATLQEAETCPMAYKCMCNNKSYPVP